MFTSQQGHRDNCDVVYEPGKPLVYEPGQKVFVKTDYIIHFMRENITPCILVTGQSDYSPSTFFSDKEIFNILENPSIMEWRSQNVCTIHPKLKHLPIGLEDTPSKLDFCSKFGDELKAMPKQDEVYTNFTNDNNPHERSCFVQKNESTDFETYMRTMATYKYALCPMGNGLDTHRFWEAQVCGCIPIVRCPKEFLPTYDGYKFISLPGWCYARMGHPSFVFKRESTLKISV